MSMTNTIPVFRPYYDEREETAVCKVLRSGWIGLGPVTEEFESAFARRVGSKYAVGVNSCTSALHLAGKLVGLGPGDEAVVPAMTFISTAAGVNYCGARPVICDVNPDNLLIDWAEVERLRSARTKAVFPVLWAGQGIEAETDLPCVYDCAQALGASWSAAGKLCCWSFHAVKNLATGDGGMLTTDDEEQYQRARRLRWMGITKSTWDRSGKGYQWGYEIPELGFKYHINDITSAIGLVQLGKLDEMQALRQRLYDHYSARLRGRVAFYPAGPGSSMHLFALSVPRRDELSAYLKERGVSTSVHHMPVHLYPMYYEHPLPVVEAKWVRLLTLPFYPGLGESEVDLICDAVLNFFR